MKNTHIWTVDALSVQNTNPQFPNDVIIVQWHVTATSPKGTVAEFSLSTRIAPASEGDFVPYDQLTEDQVIGWVKEELGAEYVATIEQNLDLNIEAQENPPPCPTPAPLPWSQVQ